MMLPTCVATFRRSLVTSTSCSAMSRVRAYRADFISLVERYQRLEGGGERPWDSR